MKEKNPDILKKAIAELPIFKLNDQECWNRIEVSLDKQDCFTSFAMTNAEKGELNKNELPTFKAPEDIWNKLEEKLNQQSPILINAIQDLPQQKAPEIIWHNIENELDHSKQRKLIPWIIRISAAAVIFILAGYFSITWYADYSRRSEFSNKSKTPESIEEGFESIYNPALCQSNPQICNTPLFKSLDKELNEIKTEIETMKPMIKGSDPQLMKYYYRLVNERAEIEKRLVKIIMQT